MPSDLKTSKDVSEYLLDRTGRALMTGDAALYSSCMALPQHVETFDGRVYCETAAHLERIFFAVVDHMHKTGVTDLVRHCVSSRFIDPDTVEATHESRVLVGNNMIQPAFPVFSILKRIEGVWKVSYCMYAITEAPDHSRALITPNAESPSNDHRLN